MCGIAGILGSRESICGNVLAEMRKKLAHRGPDGNGQKTISLPNERILALVHTRLAIIDLSRKAVQPMTDPGTGNVIVYNGEVYNYRQLRKELESLGKNFFSDSDTEVLLKAYAHWGNGCLSKFRGMFAFALWDAKQESLFCAVDPFGIKPFYYCSSGGNFTFASELRALLASGAVPGKINRSSLDSFLAYGAVQGPATILEGVRSLRPGHFLLISSDGSYLERKYWNCRSEIAAGAEACDPKTLRAILEESVSAHCVSDVPVGVFLSGGVDSSIICGLAGRQGLDLESFSVVFDEKGFSEAKYSDMIAAKFSRRHHKLCITQDEVLSHLPETLGAMDQPTIDGINVYSISRAVRERGIKVVLSGQGGDEIFGGYPTFSRLPVLKALAGSALSYAAPLLRPEIFDYSRSKIRQLLKSKGNLLEMYLVLRQLFSAEERSILMGCQTPALPGIPEETLKEIEEELPFFDTCGGITLLELRFYLANMLLRDSDFMSMRHGLEIRVPYLDRSILRAVLSVPEKVRAAGRPKSLLISAVSDILPPEIYRRKKMGFVFPWECWLRDKLGERFTGLLEEFRNKDTGLDISGCELAWQAFTRKKPLTTWSRIWALFVYLSWFKENMENG